MISNDKQEKIDKYKGHLDRLGVFYEEKPNGQIIVDRVSFWCTTDKWYDPINNIRDVGYNKFLSHLRKMGIII